MKMAKKTEEEIELLERMLSLQRDNLSLVKNCGSDKGLIKEQEEEIKETEESLKHYREVHKLEVIKSGRRNWKDSAIKFFLVYIAGASTIKIIDFMLSKL